MKFASIESFRVVEYPVSKSTADENQTICPVCRNDAIQKSTLAEQGDEFTSFFMKNIEL